MKIKKRRFMILLWILLIVLVIIDIGLILLLPLGFQEFREGNGFPVGNVMQVIIMVGITVLLALYLMK